MVRSVIRTAKPEDRFGVVSMCREFHKVSGIPFEFNAAHASRAAQEYIEGQDRLCLVLEVDGALCGVLAASITVSPLAPVRLAQELVFWVHPSQRGRFPLRMLQAYEAWARTEGCAAAGLSGLNDVRVSHFFERAGFGLSENKFLKILR